MSKRWLAQLRREGPRGADASSAVLFYVFLVIFVLVSVFPLLWVFKMSIVTKSELFASPPTILPQATTAAEYARSSATRLPTGARKQRDHRHGDDRHLPLLRLHCAYAIARLRFRFKSPIMTLILAISFFPAVAIIAPLFIQYSRSAS